ncbi:hypothetical protein FG39_gp018 [Escherichia phage vB_EcoS_FFH_1]|uniref:Uncharacterized protein n=1 Tax=Escherichia phage vB_EcoS_FFH_1 TaxID=1446489 RepID=A0A023MH60_9CAUD|nr:hypothetical protein FG39_gp018 [Escherichia phage vB_EcoS_FFH_1]AHN83450.1 hypothetical protein [Escherichia phage vB_EcoS_FFH_1]
MTLYAQQSIQVVPDHELNTWDYSFKDLTATVQFKSMKLTFAHTSIKACKDLEGKLEDARKIFGTARIPADNLINALIDAGYKLVKTEVNRPSTPVTIRDPWQSGTISMLNNSDKRLMSDMHNVPCGGVVSSTKSYKFGEDYGPSVQLKHTQEAFESDMRSVAPVDAGVSRSSVCTIHFNNPSKHGSLEDVIMEALGAALNKDKRGN